MKAFAALLASVVCALGANPYLHLSNDQPVTHQFAGYEIKLKSGEKK